MVLAVTKRSRAAGALLVSILVALAGCTGAKDDRLPVFPAKGQVMVKGAPAVGAVVQLWPEGGGGGKAYSPSGKVDEQGTFTLSTYEPNDGAPAGNYAVTVEWPERLNVLTNQWEGDKLKGRFKDPQTSKLKATIDKKPTEIPLIKID